MYRACCSCQVFTKREFSPHTFKKYPNIEFREYPCCGSRVVPCGQAGTTKQVAAFRNFADELKSEQFGKTKQMEKTAAGVVATQ